MIYNNNKFEIGDLVRDIDYSDLLYIVLGNNNHSDIKGSCVNVYDLTEEKYIQIYNRYLVPCYDKKRKKK